MRCPEESGICAWFGFCVSATFLWNQSFYQPVRLCSVGFITRPILMHAVNKQIGIRVPHNIQKLGRID